MQQSEPRDYRLAKRAYEAYHREQPQVWFEDLSHDYQMRWVNAVREVLKDAIQHTPNRGGAPRGTKQIPRIRSIKEAEAALEGVPVLSNGRRDFSRLHPPAKKRAKNAAKYLRTHRR